MTQQADYGAFHEDDLEERPEAILRLLVDWSAECCRRFGLPRDLASDVAQEVFRRLWEGRSDGVTLLDGAEALRLVEDVAAAERQSRRRELGALKGLPGGPGPNGTPRSICARLSLLGPFACDPREYERTLDGAATVVARFRGVLKDDQYRVFDWVYTAGWDIDTTCRMLGSISKRALAKRLRRIGRRIERQLAVVLEQEIGTAAWTPVAALLFSPGPTRKKIRNAARTAAERGSAVVLRGCQRVIRSDPGFLLSYSYGR